MDIINIMILVVTIMYVPCFIFDAILYYVYQLQFFKEQNKCKRLFTYSHPTLPTATQVHNKISNLFHKIQLLSQA